MLHPAAMKELAARKERLVAECELSRQVLRAEFLELRASFGHVAESVKSAQNVLRVAALVAPLATLFFAGKKSGWKGFAKAGLLGWQLFQRLRTLWTRG